MAVLHSPPQLADVATVRAAINEIEDPEMPIGIGDLGMIDAIEVGGNGVSVTLLPTFAGCPALEIMRSRVTQRVAAFGFKNVAVRWSFEHPWDPQRVSPAGVAALREHGIAPGALRGSASVACPYCRSERVERTSKFGGSLCRETHTCLTCGDTFESLKASGVMRRPADPGLISLL